LQELTVEKPDQSGRPEAVVVQSEQHSVVASAEEIINRHWKSREIPVDPYAIARSMGITVKFIEAEDNVDGGIWRRREYDPIIFLNSVDHAKRKRYVCAHQLGHFQSRATRDEYELVDYKEATPSTVQDDEEISADQFAAALLMPESEIRSVFTETHAKLDGNLNATVLALSDHFAVSVEAVTGRLEALGLA
jgi:Zn-dependent peptidase ImmA (M78 family)